MLSTRSQELTDLVEEALSRYPRSPTLWIVRGDVARVHALSIGGDPDPSFCIRCYETALSFDDCLPEAWAEIGSVYDTYSSDYPRAESAYRKAVSLGGDVYSYCGLARVLAEQGRVAEATDILSPDRCPFADHAEAHRVREEVTSGLWAPEGKRDVSRNEDAAS
jgi:hypothetical protein